MCGRYVQTKRARDRARILQLVREEEARRAESWNVAPTTLSLAVRVTPEGRVADWITWGLQASAPAAWSDINPSAKVDINGDSPVEATTADATPFRPINARLESVAEKPYFREAWKTRRCLIPADGWYEWKTDGNALPVVSQKPGQKRPRANVRKQPYYFHRRDGQPLFLAALWTHNTYCLITTPANGDLAQIHHRRPLTLREETAAEWLATAPASEDKAVLVAVPPDAIAFHPVSARVSNAREDGPPLIEPVILETTPEFLPGF